LFSFIPHSEAKPAPNGRFGYLKMRGNFGSEVDAQHFAYKLVRDYDSFHPIVHARTGVFVPISQEFSIEEVDEVKLNSDMAESISLQVDKKRKEDATKIAEIQEQTRVLREEEASTSDDPISTYIQLRVKYATLKMTYLEHQKKMNEIIPLMLKTRDTLNAEDADFPDHRAQFFEKYMEAYKRVGLDKANANEMSEAFLRFIKEDIDLPFEV
jgi:hypothetical protein